MKNMKYKVLAADDEFWSRENIRNLIPWEEYSLEFLEPACDGEEVIERIAEEKPDIILTDINMPFLDGLELLKKLQTEYPQIITIAVSGYDDFEKVKGVFVSGGLDYLLKPVGKEELVRILTKALGILEERETLRRNTETNRQKEHKLSSFMEDSEYSALLSGKLYGQFQAQPHVSSTGEFSGMAALMVKFYNIAEIAEKFDHDSLQMSLDIKTKLRKLTDGDPDAIIFNNCNKMSEFLIFTSPRTKSLQIFAEKILKEFPLDDYGPVSVILHEQTGSLDDIGNIYRDMIVLSKNEAQNIVVESNGEPYSVKYKNGIKTVGQMKIGATELAKNKDNTEPITFVPKKAGYYTFNVQTQGRDNYRFVIYVQ